MKHFVFCLMALFVFAPLHAQWIQTNGLQVTEVWALAVSGTNLFAGTPGSGVFLSTNNGTSWSEVNTGLTDHYVHPLAISGTNLFAGTNGGVFLSTNNGTSWTAVNTGLPTNAAMLALTVSGTNLFGGTPGGVFLSTNDGTSWTGVNTGLTYPYIFSLAVFGTDLFAGAGVDVDRGAIGGRGVFLSTNNGTSWTAVNTGLTTDWVYSLAVSDTKLFAGTFGGGVFLSTNNGTNWAATSTGLTNTAVLVLAVSGTNLFAGTYGSGVFLSTNNGTSWTAASTGLTNANVWSLAVSGTDLFVGTSSGVWRRPLSEMITTSVEKEEDLSPRRFALKQNYPNPFNPATTINFDLPVKSKVRLHIFNLLGEQVAELANEEVNAGYFQKMWNAGVASGLYFYRLEAISVSDPTKRFVDVKKMIQLK